MHFFFGFQGRDFLQIRSERDFRENLLYKLKIKGEKTTCKKDEITCIVDFENTCSSLITYRSLHQRKYSYISKILPSKENLDHSEIIP